MDLGFNPEELGFRAEVRRFRATSLPADLSSRQFIFEEESAAAGAPRLLPFGLKMVGPVIMRFGSLAQQARYLPNLLGQPILGL